MVVQQCDVMFDHLTGNMTSGPRHYEVLVVGATYYANESSRSPPSHPVAEVMVFEGKSFR